MRRLILIAALLIAVPAIAHDDGVPTGARVFNSTTTELWLLEELGIKMHLILKLINERRELLAEIERLKGELAKTQQSK